MKWPSFKRAAQPAVQPAETRSFVSSDPLLGQLLGASYSGSVDIEKASRMAVAARCITLIAESVASAELNIYKLNPDGGATVATDHPLFSVLVDEAYPGVSAYEMKERVSAELCQWGNSVLRIHRNGRSQVTGLQPMAWGDVTVEQLTTGRARYRWADPARMGHVEVLTADEVVHLKFRSRDGLVGRSPFELASTSTAIATTQEEATGSSAINSFRPAGIVSYPGNIDPGFAENLRTTFKEKFLGSSNTNSLIVLSQDAKWTPIQFSSEQNQVLESRQWSAYEVCRVLGVPPSAVGLLLDATWGSVADESRALVMRCLRPFGKRIEAALMTALLSPEARKVYYIEHDWSDMLSGDMKERFEAYKIAREGGWYNVDDIRAKESMGKVRGGETYIQPLNYAPLGSVALNGQHSTPQVTQ